MERFLLYLDDLDDLYGMAGLLAERLRRIAKTAFSYLLVITGGILGLLLAQAHPPIALATLILLLVTQMYRSVTSPQAATPKIYR